MSNLKRSLSYYKYQYKNDPTIIEIVYNMDYTIEDKLDKIKEHLHILKRNKKLEESIKKDSENVENGDISIKKRDKHYETRKNYVKKSYRENPEYNASVRLSAYKKYILIYPEIKEIYDNTEYSKVEKLEKIKRFINAQRLKKAYEKMNKALALIS